MSDKIYFGDFKSADDVAREFDDHGIYGADEVLIAAYGYGCYDGDAFVLYRKNGKLYEVNGGHCSCHGLERQWSPEETSFEALAIRTDLLDGSYNSYGPEAQIRLHALIAASRTPTTGSGEE